MRSFICIHGYDLPLFVVNVPNYIFSPNVNQFGLNCGGLYSPHALGLDTQYLTILPLWG